MSDWTEHQHHAEPSKDCHLCAQRSETGTREPGQQVSVGSVARPAGLMTPAPTDQIRQLREALRWIAAAASGEEQVESCEDDTDVLAHIAKYAELAGSETPAPRELQTLITRAKEFRHSVDEKGKFISDLDATTHLCDAVDAYEAAGEPEQAK